MTFNPSIFSRLIIVLCSFIAFSSKAAAPSFRNQIQPLLAKSGCSSGACHGAAAGQNGFKLSLRGYDNEADHLSITRHAFGRRINLADPARSLLLLKSAGIVPHKGAARFETNSPEYKILGEWIAAGAPGPQPNDPLITRIEVTPASATLKPRADLQLRVRAHFSNGRTEDVTRWVKYTSANESVVNVGEDGKARVVGHGEGAVTAWYLSRIAIASITVPFTNKVTASTFSKAPKRNFIDELTLDKLRSLNLPPATRCTDSEFIRRAFIDTIGILPTADESRAFLADTSTTKRDTLIELLLRRPEFIDYWTYKWSDLLLVSSRQLPQKAMWAYYHWIRENVDANTPWDQFVRKLVTSTGSTLDNGAANFFVLHDNPSAMAETTSQAFLGMSVNCAKCHNHPMEKWTNDQYYGFANMFARVRAKNGTAGEGDHVIFAATEGDLVQPRIGRPQLPQPLEGKPLPMNSTEDRRNALAAWLTARENPYFTRAIVNRVWANFLGTGLVEPVDDLRMTNPPSNAKLLEAAANYLADQKFNLKALMRAILQSETYQRSNIAAPGTESDSRFYSRYFSRRMMAEVLLDSISQVTDAPTAFFTDERNRLQTGKPYPAGLRAMQLPDANIASYFLKSFGHADRTQTCECERNNQPSVAQMLHISNGDTLNDKLKKSDNRITRLLAAKLSNEQLIDEAFLNAFARFPTPDEKLKCVKQIALAGEVSRRDAIEDLFWALMSTKEFIFNH